MPNASVGIDRLRAVLRRARSGQSTAATRFHRRAVRWAVALRRSFAFGSLQPQPGVAVVHLARRMPLEARIELEMAVSHFESRPGDEGTSSVAGPGVVSSPASGPGPTQPSDSLPIAASAPRADAGTAPSGSRVRGGGLPGGLPRTPRSARRVGQIREPLRAGRLSQTVRGGAIVGASLPGLQRSARRFLGVARRAVSHERAAATVVAAIVVFASFASALPAFGVPPTGDVGGAGTTPRLVIGGGVLGPPTSDTSKGDALSEADGWATEPLDGGALGGAVDSGVPVDGGLGSPNGGSPNGGSPNGATDPLARLADPEASAGSEQPAGPFLADGTLLKPVAVDTLVPDARDRIVLYRVQSGDTLTGIARRFGISMMTLWWANDLKSKDDLHVGQVLRIPPVDGLVVTVQDGDTLDAIAAKTGVSKETIAAFNGLTDDGLVVGQTLIVPGARGAPIPTPKPTPRPVGRSTSGTVSGPSRYGGGAFAWPVAGGFISQYYHYSHPAIDIAADYGTPVRAAAGGTVVFAGWKSNGGGYQVWISHGSGLYTGYYHLSAISVGRGQSVARGQTIGRVGTSGWATGPHLHFEVWRGYPWEAGSSRVNPLLYL